MAGWRTNKRSRQDRYNVRVTAAWLAVLLVCITEIFFYTWCSVQCLRLNREIGRQEEIAAALETEKKKLRIEMARLKTPARIMQIAREELGMIIPETDQVIVIP